MNKILCYGLLWIERVTYKIKVYRYLYGALRCSGRVAYRKAKLSDNKPFRDASLSDVNVTMVSM